MVLGLRSGRHRWAHRGTSIAQRRRMKTLTVMSLCFASTVFAAPKSMNQKPAFSLSAAKKIMTIEILNKEPVRGGWSKLQLLSVSGTKKNPLFELRAISKNRVDPKPP